MIKNKTKCSEKSLKSLLTDSHKKSIIEEQFDIMEDYQLKIGIINLRRDSKGG